MVLSRYLLPDRVYLSRALSAFVGRPSESPSHIEGFKPIDGTALSDSVLSATVQRHFSQEGKTQELSGVQLEALREIIRQAHARDVRVILFSSPVHDDYSHAVPMWVRDSFDREMSSLADLADVDYVDFSTLGLPDSLYYDFDHTNSVGAAMVSVMFKAALDEDARTPR